MKFIPAKSIGYIPASHEDPSAPGVWKKVMVTYADVLPGRLQMVNWAKLPIEKAFKAHYHEDMDEVFLLMSGRAKMIIDNTEVIMMKGDCVIVGMKEVHMMQNIGKVPVTYVVLGVSLGKGGKTINV